MIEVISNNGKRCAHGEVYMMVIARWLQIKGHVSNNVIFCSWT